MLDDDGSVIGVAIEGADGLFEVRARGGVVLATGGFEHDAKLVRTFLRGPLDRAVSVPTNTGDGLRMAMRIGADLADMREAWWVATIDVEVPGRGLVPWQVNSERTRPHSIMVNDDGVRFTNEAANYNALGNAFHVVDVARFAYVNHPAWLLLDHHFLSSYGLAGHRPPVPTPSWLIEAASIPALAQRIGVPTETLVATIARWNEQAAAGVDPDFHRGESHHDRAWGDHPAFGLTPQATIGPIDTPPYLRDPGFLRHARDERRPAYRRAQPGSERGRSVIDGLYAAGNAMGSVMGMTYGGARRNPRPGARVRLFGGHHAAAWAAGVSHA